MTTPLRVALCCQQDILPHPVPAYRFWADYFRQALTEAGHVVLECPQCDWARGLLPLGAAERAVWRTETWNMYIDWLRREHARQPVNLSLHYLFPAQVDPTGVQSERDLGIPTINFFCDNVREFRRVPKEFRSFDLHWVPEFKAIPLYKAAALTVLHAPMPCWVPRAQRQPPSREAYPPTFIGTRDAQRESLFGKAIEQGLTVELRGTGWAEEPPSRAPIAPTSWVVRLRRQWDIAAQSGWAALYRKFFSSRQPVRDFSRHARPAPRGDDYLAVLRECTVCIGVSRYPSWRFPFDRPDSYSRLRDIEAPMAGACYLTEWTDGLDQLYELGTEIETYRGPEELVEKTNRLSTDTERRIRLRTAGQKRALSQHAIAHTIERIRQHFGIP